MRILFIHSVPDVYGASRSLLRLASRLAEDGKQVLVVLPEDGPLSLLLKQAGVGVVHVPDLMIIRREQSRSIKNWMRGLLSSPASVTGLLRIIEAFQPDCIHTNTSLIVAPALAAKLKRIPHVWHVREIFSDFPRLWKPYQWFLYLFSDVIVCVSQAVASQFHPFIRKRKVQVIYNGLPQSEFEDVNGERIRSFRDKFGLNGHLLVGLVGRIKIGRKGQDVFAKSVALLKDDFPQVRFICIGSPFPGNEAHLDMLMDVAQTLDVRDRLICTGDVDDIKAAYASLDVSVVPSVLPESFSGVVIESMAMGKPVIGTLLGGTVEQIEDSITGFLVFPNDAESLARRIRQLLSNDELREQLGRQARQRFLDKFEITRSYESISAVYSRLPLADSDE